MYKLLLVSCCSLLIVGCDERYRYPCQDPANWKTVECKAPLCEVSRTCPEHIFKNQDEVLDSIAEAQKPEKKHMKGAVK